MARRRRRRARASKRSKKVVVTVSVPAGAHARVSAKRGKRRTHRRLKGRTVHHRLPGRKADGTFKKGRHGSSKRRSKSGSKSRRYRGTITVLSSSQAYHQHRPYGLLVGKRGKKRGPRRRADGTFAPKKRKSRKGGRRKSNAWTPFGLLGP